MKKQRTLERIKARFEHGCIAAYKNGSQQEKWIIAMIGYVPK